MKQSARILGTVCASAIALSMCSMFSVSASAAATVRIMGDLNNDMVIDSADAQETLCIYTDALTGLISDAVNDENENADINMDGKISVEDAANILSYYCQTLVGGQPLWADFREVSYESGSSYAPEPVSEEYGRKTRTFELRGLYLEVGCASGQAGETVTVPVYVAGLPKLAGFQLSLKHDTALTAVSITSKVAEDQGWNQEIGYVANPFYDDNRGVIVAAQAYNFSLADGYILSEYSYTIPKDAKPGDHYCIAVDPSWTKFVTQDCCYTNPEDFNDKVDPGSYQYTALSGLITVK